jgi:hypothetical protein
VLHAEPTRQVTCERRLARAGRADDRDTLQPEEPVRI